MLVFILGLLSIYKFITEDPEANKPVVIYKTENMEDRRKAAAFAQEFVEQYFTFNGKKQEEYFNRIKVFLADYLTRPVNLENTSMSEVKSSYVWEVVKPDNRHYNVKLKVNFLSNGKLNSLYVVVPLRTAGTSFKVTSFPSFTQEPENNINLDSERFSGESSEISEDELLPVLNNFFKAYFEGDKTQISYFILKDSNVKVAEFKNKYGFVKIDNLYIYKEAIILDVLVREPLTKAVFRTTYYLEIKKAEDRWYITDLRPQQNKY